MVIMDDEPLAGGARLRGFARVFGLSGQEWAVLTTAMDGCAMKEGAARLGISPKTVETYWRRIYAKTGRRTQLEVLAEVLWWSVGELE
jgi:DNA-binding CsgD family transcriptional regulator